MAKQTFNSLIEQMEASADRSGCDIAFWQQVALVLKVWDSVKDGWMPVVHFDPRYNDGLRDLAVAAKRFGHRLTDEANRRAFAA